MTMLLIQITRRCSASSHLYAKAIGQLSTCLKVQRYITRTLQFKLEVRQLQNGKQISKLQKEVGQLTWHQWIYMLQNYTNSNWLYVPCQLHLPAHHWNGG